LKEFLEFYPKCLKSRTILYKIIIKPVFDFIIGFLLLVVLSPIIFSTMILLSIANKGNVFFLQLRPGLHGKPFKIIKFKTMRDAFDPTGIPLPDEERLTRIGQFVRSGSLDELLQLINVVKGDMSLVGPRPLLMQYLSRYSSEQARRHEVKPGITGWAQVNGRNAISWEEKFNLDIEYVDKQNFSLDVKILWLTFLKVITRQGISANGHVTMDEFKGSNLS
jgi:lipopolysaccharide/colanic/teichoic acid biosynthesis glycosyltransferase